MNFTYSFHNKRNFTFPQNLGLTKRFKQNASGKILKRFILHSKNLDVSDPYGGNSET